MKAFSRTLADLRSSSNSAQSIFPSTSCTASQTLTWTSLTDTLTCTPITIDAAAVTTGAVPLARGGTGSTNGSIAADANTSLTFSSGSGTSDVILASSSTGRIKLYPGSPGVYINGDLGIGSNSTPRGRLDVVGGSIVGSPSISNSTPTINFATGNIQSTPNSCTGTPFTLTNMKDGGTYVFIIKGTANTVGPVPPWQESL